MTPTGGVKKAVEGVGVVWELWRRGEGGVGCGERELHSRRRDGVDGEGGVGEL